MSRIQAKEPIEILSAGDMSGDLTTSAVKTLHLSKAAFTFKWTGAATGDFYIQGSADGGITWDDLTLDGGVPAAAGSAGHHTVNLQGLGFDQMRARYDFSSGTGALTVVFCGKGN
jgi:hypothetical protein